MLHKKYLMVIALAGLFFPPWMAGCGAPSGESYETGKCVSCNGTGKIECVCWPVAGFPCSSCKGNNKDCPTCKGTGIEPCGICGGTGYVKCRTCGRN